MEAHRTGIIIQAGQSAVDGVKALRLNLGPKGQLEQWLGPATHSGALLAVPSLAVSWETPEREKVHRTHTKSPE